MIKQNKKGQAQRAYNAGAQAYNNGDYTNALQFAVKAFELAPQNKHHSSLLAHSIKYASFQKFSPEIKKTILNLLRVQSIDHQNLCKPWLSVLLLDPSMQAISNIMNDEKYDVNALKDALHDPYLLLGLEKFIVFDTAFESALRKTYGVITEKNIEAKKFLKALHQYNIYTEGLIYPLPKEELYPKIDTSIQSLSAAQNDIHKSVREHYEANPYPRWISCEIQTPTQKTAQSTHKHLIAGCGTGYGTCMTALRYPNAQITAIDLSLASMSYAKRKARELGIKNVKFLQADILDIDNLEGEFDIIECSGVLHHMKEPLEGWKSLLDKLKSGGKMHIGLYSKLARADIIAARKLIEKNGFKPDNEGIKAAREMIINLPDDHLARRVTSRRDFYSISSCRDLIFHTQEYCYTIDEIVEALQTLGLKFDGFDFDDALPLRDYAKMFPDDKEMIDLKNWQKFEEKHPDTFRGMYQFWCS